MEEKVLVLRCCNSDGTSFGGFQWPTSGPVECPDWNPTKKCGAGLHGWLWGSGQHHTCGYDYNDPEILWFVVEVLKTDVVDLEGKVKFPRGNVVYCGDRETAIKMIVDRAPAGAPVMFQTLTAGDCSKLIAGYGSTLIANFYSSNIAVEVRNNPGPGQLKANVKYKVEFVNNKLQFVEARNAQ